MMGDEPLATASEPCPTASESMPHCSFSKLRPKGPVVFTVE
jgi:hypothetical protein